MILISYIYIRYKDEKWTYNVIIGLYFILYSVALFIFKETQFFSYILPIMSASVFFLNKRSLVILTICAIIINTINVLVYQRIILGLNSGPELIFITAMLVLTLIVIILTINEFSQFMKENREEILEVSTKNEDTAKRIICVVQDIEEKFNVIMNDLVEINQETSTNTSAIKAIAETTDETVNAIVNQANMTTGIQEALKQSGENVAHVQQTTIEVLNIVEQGVGLAQKLTMQAKNVNASTSQMSGSTELLGKRVNDVLDIVDVIVTISNQTNLLALNASIEAARAGEAGRGFSVVADEIRKLSDDTKKSTQQITEIIKELSQVTENTVKILGESVTSIDRQNEVIIEVDRGFTKAGEHISNLKGLVDGIVKDVNAINQSNGMIVDSINQISASTEEISRSSEASLNSSETIKGRMDKFTKEIKAICDELTDLAQSVS